MRPAIWLLLVLGNATCVVVGLASANWPMIMTAPVNVVALIWLWQSRASYNVR